MDVTRLSDEFGDYLLSVRCRKCQHRRTVDPHSLAQIVGWNAQLSIVALRLRCSKCSARNCEITTMRRPKSRR